MDLSLKSVLALHTRKILSYKRLLERAQASTAAQLHALQAEVSLLRSQAAAAAATIPSHSSPTFCVCGKPKDARGYWSGWRADGEEDAQGGETVPLDIATAIKMKEEGGGFGEADLRKAVRALGLDDRMRLCVLPHLPLSSFYIFCTGSAPC
jgi:pyrimidine and pyridine-specific 5'-nucleotidase